jgi:hypothetical protein
MAYDVFLRVESTDQTDPIISTTNGGSQIGQMIVIFSISHPRPKSGLKAALGNNGKSGVVWLAPPWNDTIIPPP